jgi:uncharacterized repeat protein (TIGR01451 family)
VNVNHRWLGTSLARVRMLVGGLVLLGAGCAVLGWSSRLRQTAANAGAQSIAGESSILPSLITTEGRLPEPASEEAQVKARSLFAGLPLIFEPNQGQGNLDANDERAKFVTRGSGYSLFLGSEGAILSMVSHDRAMQDRAKSGGGKGQSQQLRVNSVQMKLAGANPNASLSGLNRLPGKSNYFIGNDPIKWRRGVPQFARVRYENVYRGINLVFYGNQGRLEYDFQVAPGSDPAQAELEFHGAKQLELKDGALLIKSEGGSVQLGAPRVYQEIAGRQQAVEGSFVLRGADRAGFTVGAYDHSRELIIDPTLTFATYFGGSGDEHASSVAVDGSFNIYLAGSTTSPNLPAAGVQPTLGGAQNVYVAKITPPLGSLPAVLDYVTYLGGDGSDTPVGIRVDGAGDPYVAGTTSSSNFPTSLNAYQKVPSTPGTHVFVTKLQFDATALLYSSYLSGTGADMASGMTIDSSGDVFVTGTTTSQDVASGTDQFPASSLAFQGTSRAPGLAQFFVTKVNTSAPAGQGIAYSTYFGGGAFNTTDPIVTGGGIAVDSSGNVYFTGSTNFLFTGCLGCGTTDFPILNAYQPCLDQPPAGTIVNPICSTTTVTTEPDAFVAKLNVNSNSQGQQLVWSTYLGGTASDAGVGVAIDTGAANVYVVGTTNSIDIGTSVAASTSAAYQPCLDQPGVAAGSCTPPTNPPNDAFVARLNNPANTTGTGTNVTLNYFSYLGGANDEAGTAIAVDSGSGALVTGWTQSTDFPIFPASNPIQSALAGTQDAFMARLNTIAVVGQTTTASWANYYGGTGIDQGTGVALDVNQNAYFVGDTNSADLQFNKALPSTSGVNGSANNGGYDAFVTQLGTAVTLSITGVLTQGTNQTFISAGNQATFTYTVTNNGPDLATNLTFTNNLSQGTGVPLTFNSASTTSGSCGGGSTNAIVSCSLPSLQSGSTATITVVVTPTPNSSGAPATFNGGTAQVTGQGNIVLAQTSVPAQMSDFLITADPADQTISAAGATAGYNVTLNPHPIYASSISLGCSGLPTAATCTFTTSSVTLQVGPETSTMNIATVARPVVTPAASLRTRHFYAIWLALPGFTLVGLGMGGDRRRRRVLGIFMLCALFGLLLLQPGCSGGSNSQTPVSGTPPGTYTVTVSATSGTDTKSTTVNLTVP